MRIAHTNVNDFNKNVNHNAPKTTTEETQKKESTLAADNTENKDRVEKDTAHYTPAYTKGTAKSGISPHALSETGKSAKRIMNDSMREMVANTLNAQAANGAVSNYVPLSKDSAILDALKAAEATSEGKDYWSVDATAERIFTFAKTLAGDDVDKLDKMREAFDKGFNQALGEKRGKLPSISYETRDKVYELFDNYKKELQEKKAPETVPNAVDAN
ncbi:MAG: hypothetical protein FWH05_00690 [Oscillospiraceae bacterium]|nr:hypothetical protein [Oscillospiraceae bacterium]